MSRSVKPVYHRGDLVEIVEPRLYVRVGYPMGFDGVRGELTEKYHNEVMRDLYALRDAKIAAGWPAHLAEALPVLHSEILRQMTLQHLHKHHFGGNERTIHTKLDEQWRGRHVRVDSKRVVKTGRYRCGCAGGGYFEDDGCPPELRDVKTHVILRVSWDGPDIFDYDYFEIEAANVRLVDQESLKPVW
jgi:hypothetical protein